MGIELGPANEVDFNVFTATLNRAYADYYIPLSMGPDELRARILQDDIRLDLSCVVHDGDQMVGVAMLARRGDLGWIGGVGVIPQYRGRGIGRRIMQYVLEAARVDGIKRVQLEVITENTRARSLYDSLNFEEVRLLHLVEGGPNQVLVADDYTYEQVAVEVAVELQPTFHVHPVPWQRVQKALRGFAPQLQAYVARHEGAVMAYTVGVFRPGVIRYVDLAHTPADRRGAPGLRGLVCYLHQQFPNVSGGIINIASNDPAWAVLYLLGYQPYMSQHEMTRVL